MLNDFTERTIRTIARKIASGLIQIGIEAASETKKRTPIDTGNLRRSIQAVSGSKELVPGASHIGTAGEFDVVIGTNVSYADRQEARPAPASGIVGGRYMARAAEVMGARGVQIFQRSLR